MQSRKNSVKNTLRAVAVSATLLLGAALIAWADEPSAAKDIDFVDPTVFAELHPGLPDLAGPQQGDGLCDPCHY